MTIMRTGRHFSGLNNRWLMSSQWHWTNANIMMYSHFDISCFPWICSKRDTTHDFEGLNVFFFCLLTRFISQDNTEHHVLIRDSQQLFISKKISDLSMQKHIHEQWREQFCELFTSATDVRAMWFSVVFFFVETQKRVDQFHKTFSPSSCKQNYTPPHTHSNLYYEYFERNERVRL